MRTVFVTLATGLVCVLTQIGCSKPTQPQSHAPMGAYGITSAYGPGRQPTAPQLTPPSGRAAAPTKPTAPVTSGKR